ncbi:aminoglycoside phosphotransferase family protein [Planktomarina temperata]|nr:aminoglycoside phosphotransferase family protein [Planktomarina temperata]
MLDALLLHEPGSTRGKIFYRFIKLLCRSGMLWPLKQRRLEIYCRKRCYGLEDLSSYLSIYIGNLDGNQRVTILRSTDEGSKEILKIASNEESIFSTKNEHNALRFLAGTCVGDKLPYVIGHEVVENKHLFSESYRKKESSKWNVRRRASQSFLLKLMSIAVTEISLGDMIDRLEKPTDFYRRLLFKRLRELDPDTPVITCISHGDFTDWNTFMTAQGFYVFDWELFSYGRPLLYDACHYAHTRYEFLGRKREVKEFVDFLDEYITPMVEAQYLTTWQKNIYIGLWLLNSHLETEFQSLVAEYFLNRLDENSP